jgi:Xaa-Pro aminopeptidase
VLVTNLLNVRYLSGFSGTFAALIITADQSILLTDSRYTEQAAMEAPGFSVEQGCSKWLESVAEIVSRLGIRKLGFEARWFSYADWKTLGREIPDVDLLPMEPIVEEMRLVKDDKEIEVLKKAIRITDDVCRRVLELLRPGMTEKDVALEIVYAMLKNGADKEAFDTIVTSGPRSAMPHGKPTDSRLVEGEFVLMDFGAYHGGYHGDITRTVVLGTADAKQEEMHSVVMEAQSRAIKAIRPGATGVEIDSVARDYIAERGYGEFFGHSLGHGLGLEIHDGAILTPRSDIVLQPGMVVTVEPGIYVPHLGGVRIEDVVLITESGCEVLTSCRRNILA